MDLEPCQDCANGEHGIPLKRNKDICACCYENVGFENLIDVPFESRW